MTGDTIRDNIHQDLYSPARPTPEKFYTDQFREDILAMLTEQYDLIPQLAEQVTTHAFKAGSNRGFYGVIDIAEQTGHLAANMQKSVGLKPAENSAES